MYLTTSRKIRNIANLKIFLGADTVQFSCAKMHRRLSSTPNGNAFIGWGHKPTADKARAYAKKFDVPYVAIEDGFLRSLDLGCKGVPPLSLIVDRTGIYYDSQDVSDLENRLNSHGWETQQLIDQAQIAIDCIRKNNLSKYNASPRLIDEESLLGPKDAFPRVLLIDQTQKDASVTLGMASSESFFDMLSEAKRLYPNAHYFIKTHPDVIAGKKKGYLTNILKDERFTVISQDVAPLSLLAQMDAVFCVTSQMGFEALLLGLPVYCFGMPFYAGWGLTFDYVKCARRTVKRTLEEVFAAAYILYPRYLNPIKEELTDIFGTINRLSLQREKNEENRGAHACFGYSLWKHPHAKAFTQSTGATHRFFKYFKGAERAVRWALVHHGDVVAWASKCSNGKLQKLCEDNGISLVRMEDGFIRSVGLGSNFHWPYSLVLDRTGIYYDSNRPSDLENILNSIQTRVDIEELRQRALKLQELIVREGLTKYNVGTHSVPRVIQEAKKAGKRILLVPGQVEDDASVRLGGCGICSNLDLLSRVRTYNVDAYIIYKPHPDVEVKNRKGKIPDQQVLKYADCVVRDVRMDVLLKEVDEVHTLTSLTGFEALMRGIQVTTYGGPFYAGWGLTKDLAPVGASFLGRRTSKPTLTDLIAATLILYPSYYDWQTQSFCSVEDVCYRLSQNQGQMKGKYIIRLFSWIREELRRWL